MKLCVLSDETFDDYNPAPFLKDFDYDEVYVKKPAIDFMRDLIQEKHYDVFLNLCDGGVDEEGLAHRVVERRRFVLAELQPRAPRVRDDRSSALQAG